ncbi:MAG: hypothetical protein ACYS0G_06240 [Planctomycetota bacterium]|jgi:hypothetical protein
MAMTADQLRAALRDLNGQRDVRIGFVHAEPCVIEKALLVPAEEDMIVKLTDGSREYLVDAERVVWVEIG